MSDETPGFLARWSRRKREPETEEADVAPDTPPAERPACPIPTLPEIDLASLPSIETLTAESDFSLFLRPGIPTALRSAALRRMWSLDPAIRDYIGPVEYQWDFNAPGGLPLGFANELIGDVAKLLTQAIGQVAEPVEGAQEPPGILPEEPPVDTPALPDLPMAELPELIEAAPPAPEPAQPLQRRHGSALPA